MKQIPVSADGKPLIRAAIFDLDGTLLDTLDDLWQSTNRACRAFGYAERTREEVRHFVGNGVQKLIERALPENASDIKDVLAYFKQDYAAHCTDLTAPYPGILTMLDRLKAQGIACAIVSNKFDHAVKALSAHYFGDRITLAVGESETVRRKPAPDSVQAVLRALRLDAHEAVYIGDSDVDIETAENAFLPCCSVLWGFRDEAFLRAHGAKNLFRTPEDLTGYLLSGYWHRDEKAPEEKLRKGIRV